MSSLHTAELYSIGDVKPFTFTDEVDNGNHPIQVKITRLAGEGFNPDDPGYLTVITPNGYAEDASVWDTFRHNLVREAYAGGLALTAISYDDPTYFKQASFTATVNTLARHYRQQGGEEHDIWLVPHSRGGNSVAHCGEALAKEGIIKGIRTMASPAGRLGFKPEHLTGWANELLQLPGELHDRDKKAIYLAIARNVISRSIWHPYGTRQEVQEIISGASNVASRMRDISNVAGVSVTAELRHSDMIVPCQQNAGLLGAAGLGSDVVSLMPGNHASPLLDVASRAALLKCIQPSVLAQAG